MLGGAIYSYSLNSHLTIASCKFIGNTATSNGGGIYLGENHLNFVMSNYKTYSNSLQLQTSHPYESKIPVNGTQQKIYSKYVRQAGVSKYILSFDSQSTIWHNDFFYIYSDMNKTTILFQSQGYTDPWPGVDVPSLVVYGDQFYIEMLGPDKNLFLSNTYWGFLCYVYPVYASNIFQLSSSSSSLFDGNTATNGGAMYMDSINTYAIIVSVDFIGNKAITNGGGIVTYFYNYGSSFQQLRFINNSASSGGGMLLATSNYGVQINECLFSNNTAVLGSGIYFGAYNGQGPVTYSASEVLINDTYFIENYAESGAGVLVDYENVVSFNNVSFIDNIASSVGAAVNIDSINVVDFTSTIFTSNLVSDNGIGGGGIASQTSNVITINNTVFNNNSASSGAGGAIFLQGNTILTVSGSNFFQSNSADTGGAICGESIPQWTTTNGSLTLIGNEAMIGSAIALSLLTDLEIVITNITMIDNKAKLAGTFFWLCTGTSQNNLSSCQEPRYQNLVFTNNTAQYGNTFSTQPIYIRTSADYNVTIYDGPLNPSLTLTLYDFYDNEVVSDIFTPTTASVVSYSCDGFVGTLGSSTIEVANQGIVTFSDISANCNPNGNLVVQYTSQPSAKYFNGISVNAEYTLKTSSVFNFRSCFNGEKYSHGACIACDNGTYSLVYSETQGCVRCPSEALDCYANQIYLSECFWRISDTSDIIFSCPYMGCKGGYGTT